MASSMERTARRSRRHRTSFAQTDRQALEREGWRTLLDYREDHVRADDGELLHVASCWIAEAELSDGRPNGRLLVARATSERIEEAWALLRVAAADACRRPYDGAGDI